MSPAFGRRSSGAPPTARIGVDLHTLDGIYQGSRSHLLGMYREAVALAPDLHFVMLVANPRRIHDEEPALDRANVSLMPMPHASGPMRLAVQLAWHQWQHRIDLLHVQYRLPLLPVGPCACTVHDVLFETHPQYFGRAFAAFSRLASRHAVRRARVLLTVSEYSRRQIADRYGLPLDRIVVTPNAADLRRFRPGPGGEDAVRAHGLAPGGYVCTVGRLEPRKNHATLFRAYARLPRPRPPLVVVGQRDFGVAAIFAQVAALGLQDDVRFLEGIADDALPALLRHAALFAFPSHAEGFGMPVLEAMASGVPVVAGATTALPEVCGGAATLVDPADAVAMAEALREGLALDPAARAARVARGLEQARRFTWRASAVAMVAAFRSALADHSSIRADRAVAEVAAADGRREAVVQRREEGRLAGPGR